MSNAEAPDEATRIRWAKWDDLRARQAAATTDAERAALAREEAELREEGWQELMDEDLAKPESWWWLSFCDPAKPTGEQFLGVCIVKGGGAWEAIQNAWAMKINPGGEVQSLQIPEEHLPDPKYHNRLMSKAELEEAGLA